MDCRETGRNEKKKTNKESGRTNTPNRQAKSDTDRRNRREGKKDCYKKKKELRDVTNKKIEKL